MKQSQLKALIKEIVRTYTEMQGNQSNSSWTVKGDEITLENFELPDGRYIGAIIEFSGGWEYGSIEGTHRESPYFTIENWQVTAAWDMETKTPVPVDDMIKTAVDKEMDVIANDVAAKVEPPEPNFP